MKTIKINGFTMSLIVGFTILVYACKTDMMDYEGVDGVYFVMQRKPPSGYGDPEQYEYVDTTYIPFGTTSSKDTTLFIRVRVMGDVKNYDRYVTIKVDPKATTAEANIDYIPFDDHQTIKAGERQVDIPCRITWNEKLAFNPDSTFYLAVKLEENEFFSLPLKKWYPVGDIYGDKNKMINPLVHVIGINDQLGKPNIWNQNYWGNFSPTKIKLMCAVLGAQISDFEKYSTMDINRQIAYGRIFAKYLREEKEAGRTVYDYDALGNKFEMTMGPNAK